MIKRLVATGSFVVRRQFSILGILGTIYLTGIWKNIMMKQRKISMNIYVAKVNSVARSSKEEYFSNKYV